MAGKHKETENKQLLAMLIPARERIQRYSPEELSAKSGIAYYPERKEFIVQSLGKDISISWPDCRISPELNMWHSLTLLQYLGQADGSPLSGNLIGLPDMRGGLGRGIGFDKDISLMFKRFFTGITVDEFKAACVSSGGRIIKGSADVTAIFQYAPRFPITLCFYESDEDFPASGKLLVDKNAEHYLTLEAAGGACSATVNTLYEELNKNKDRS